MTNNSFSGDKELNKFIAEFEANFPSTNKKNISYTLTLTTENKVTEKVHMSGNNDLSVHFGDGLQLMVSVKDEASFNKHWINLQTGGFIEVACTIKNLSDYQNDPRTLYIKGKVENSKECTFSIKPTSVEFTVGKVKRKVL